jgi:TPP-dependent pyruvate/acetoin dehydrogenase alpha subunit
VEFYAAAYPLMFLSRHLDERMEELFKKGYAKGL